ncbi:MAG: membrane dipeptidase [Gammaproteobacteria bacterium]|nr:MAG: membrane dipeptidase [Gammaproteobacteria bacterium]RLA36405.1 MAG: membrane dipeptidase [Gammaproteobacteria bacterium]
MLEKVLVTVATALMLASCGSENEQDAAADVVMNAREIAQSSIIIDGHVDVPYRLQDGWEDVSVATDGGDFDYPRAVAGGLNAPFISIYTSPALEAEGKSKERADEVIDLVNRIVNESPDKFAIAWSPNDVERQFAAGLISFPLGMENGSPIAGDLANLQHFYDRGIRYISLAHSMSNHLADSSYDDNKQWGGLSDFGAEVVREMNRLGIMVDVSHASDEAFWDMMETTRAPAIASHSSARHFTKDLERNIDDDMIIRLAENGGVVMINFGSRFLTERAKEYEFNRRDEFMSYLETSGMENSRDLQKEFNDKYATENGAYPYATVAETLDHFDHVVNLTSVDHVGIGSDYDGIGDTLPIDLKDVSSYPALVEGLLGRGYSESDIKKILGGNLLRVWREVEAVAAEMSKLTEQS